jgi:hypothetical protein
LFVMFSHSSFIFSFCNAPNRTILLSGSEALPHCLSVREAMRWIQAFCVCLAVQWPAFYWKWRQWNTRCWHTWFFLLTQSPFLQFANERYRICVSDTSGWIYTYWQPSENTVTAEERCT